MSLRPLAPVLLLLLFGCASEPEPSLEEVPLRSSSEEIEAVLQASAHSWIEGDLDGFIDDYSVDPPATFIGSTGLRQGRDEIRRGYEASYWAPGAARDSLRFEDLDIRAVGTDHAVAVGRYVLYQKTNAVPEDSVTASGWFSLIWERQVDGWKILHDHSSGS